MAKQETTIVGDNNTKVKITGQQEMLVHVNNADLSTTGLAKETTTVLIKNLLTTINTSLDNIESALTGKFTPGAILGSSLSFPYDFPTATYKAVTLIVPTGQTIDFEGATLPAGTYNFSGEGAKTSETFQLTNPSVTPSGIILLTVE